MSENYTARQKLAEVEREIAFRIKTYKRLIQDGRMKAHAANYHTDIMRAIAQDYYRLSLIEDNEQHAAAALQADRAQVDDEDDKVTILSGG
jgi:hypothetical protein